MFELDEALDWRAALREHRKARGFTQTRLARDANLSLSALKQYETGQRHPSADALDAIIAALGLTAEQSSAIRAGAGYAPDMKRIFYDRLGPFELADLEEQTERYDWPVFVTNISADILGANRSFFRTIGPELTAAFRAESRAAQPARRRQRSVVREARRELGRVDTVSHRPDEGRGALAAQSRAAGADDGRPAAPLSHRRP